MGLGTISVALIETQQTYGRERERLGVVCWGTTGLRPVKGAPLETTTPAYALLHTGWSIPSLPSSVSRPSQVPLWLGMMLEGELMDWPLCFLERISQPTLSHLHLQGIQHFPLHEWPMDP